MKKHALLSAALAAAMTISFQASAWKPSAFFVVENESEHDNPTWDHNSGTSLTTGIVGGTIEEGNWLFSGSYGQSYQSAKRAYKKNQNNLFVTYLNTYQGPWGGQDSDFSLKVGYRGENHSRAPASNNALNAASLKTDLISNEQRNEYWIVPTANYKFSRNFRIHGQYTYRYIDRQLTYLKRFEQPKYFSETINTSSDIQSGYAGFRYTFEKGVTDFTRNFIEVNYYFTTENLKNTLYNDEHFIWVRGYVPYKVNGYIGGISPYVYWDFKEANRDYYNSYGTLLRSEEASRPRYGMRLSQNLPSGWSIAFDGYYSPRKHTVTYDFDPKYTGNVIGEDNVDINFLYGALELTKRF
ncbi:hypothetical protein [Thorsellia anophelis]|uniref:Omptin family outer membrane protease n=1 Tax=Thorsellia anophelis DSM 18579 TaxID=1123402 RepID=A0A1I0ACZ6_9GAMM|nr:hypothetical protein [Thorsellia anophelis]SES92050.1 hypothetical protein SAMN02583745_00898 [Thorsellia anophelis DSM 18579]